MRLCGREKPQESVLMWMKAVPPSLVVLPVTPYQESPRSYNLFYNYRDLMAVSANCYEAPVGVTECQY